MLRATTFAAAALTTSTLASNVFRACQQPSVQQDFDLDAYLGLWYEQRRDKGCAYESGVCTTASYSMNDDGSVRVLNNDYEQDKGKWGGGVGKATVVDPSKDEGYLKVKFVPLQPAGDYKIMETDYQNYTVLYTCAGLPGIYNIEYVWILTRDIYPSDVVMQHAMDVISEKVPEYDLSALQATPQGQNALTSGEDCPYASAPTSPAKGVIGWLADYIQ